MGKIEVQSLKKSTYFLNFSDNFVQNIVKFSHKIFAIFGLKYSKLRRFFSFWKWTEDEDEDGSLDKNLRSFEDLQSFVATLANINIDMILLQIVTSKTYYSLQCCNEASKICEASKIFVQRSIFVFIFSPFSETEESLYSSLVHFQSSLGVGLKWFQLTLYMLGWKGLVLGIPKMYHMLR